MAMPTAMPTITSLAVHRQDYPAGQAGVDQTIAKMVSFILEGRHNPLARQFAEGVIRQAGVAPNAPLSNRQAAQILLTYVRGTVRYRPDPHMTEMVQKPTVTLCVPGAAACIPVGDCDDGTCVLGWLCTGYGIPCRILVQHFNSTTDHVMLEIQDDGGTWLACDFSNFNSENNPIGWKPNASSEYRIDPFDKDNLKVAGARDVEFVAVGKIPVSISGVPVVTLGRLPMRHVGAASPTAFAKAAVDLANEVAAPITAGDTYLAAGEINQAISSYQAAGQAGAVDIGPEIDSAGAPSVTQPLTQQAWTMNAALQAVSSTSTSSTDAATAQTAAKGMLALYQQALVAGSGSRGPAPPLSSAIGWGIGLGVLAGLTYAWVNAKSSKSRRSRSR
jgi:Transglutaminase-like superfamily